MKDIDFSAITAYEKEQEQFLEDINSLGIVFRHKKTGARLCVISNDDPNKTFCAAFRTPPENSTGVPHIIEHTVLCGSKDFPARDPFMQLAKGSLHTFLNAMTYPDKTLYPVASYNDKDFQNLMHVYLDAVFYPNLYKRKEIFMQEGWHYHLEDADAPLEINGVVYSEMKGAMSSPDSIVFEEFGAGLYPNSTYGVNSGGDPDVIPELTYEYYTDFHRRYYHPSNSYIFLYGDMDVVEKLKWIDENYLSNFDRLEVDSSIKTTEPFGCIKEITKKYSIAEDEDEDGKTYLTFACSCGSMLDNEECTAWRIISEVLIGMPGAPLKQALMDAGIGQDIYGGFEDHLLTPAFIIVAKNAKKEDKQRFKEIIFETLEKIVKEGINEKAILGNINNSEYRWRESDYGGTSKGIYYIIDMLQTWLYDDSRVFDAFRKNERYEKMRSYIGTSYYTDLIQKRILDTNHGILLSVEPEKGLTEKKNAELAKKLADYKATLSKEQIDEIVASTKKLIEYQTAEATEEELSCIPSIERTDIKREAENFSNVECNIAGFPAIRHEYETNGITYVKLMFNIGSVPTEKLPYLSFLSSVLGQIDTERFTASDLTSEIKIHTGDVSFGLSNYKVFGKKDESKLIFTVNIKAFADKIPYAFELASEMMTASKFCDTKRLREILGEDISYKQRQIIGSGNAVGIARIKSYYTARGVVDEYLGGIENYKFKKNIFDNFDANKDALSENLYAAAGYIFDTKNMMISIAADEAGVKATEGAVKAFADKLAELDHKDLGEAAAIVPEAKNEGFMTPSLIQFLVKGGNLFDAGYKYDGALAVVRTAANCDYLYNMIRLKGGAYGCGCGFAPDCGDVFFYSYRDPKLAETNDVYMKTPDFVAALNPDEKELTKYIIGTFSGIDTPKSISGKIGYSLSSYITGRTYEDIQTEREQILDVTVEKMNSTAKMIKDVLDQGYTCCVGNAQKIKDNSDLFKTIENIG
ncbi:MAG: insulinase family protein [Ruminococcaceae bacterium]|nr:insulinase family protein [Oscillospiraceae bacterium]